MLEGGHPGQMLSLWHFSSHDDDLNLLAPICALKLPRHWIFGTADTLSLVSQTVRGGAVRKAEKLRDMLEESSDLQELRCPLPLDPSVHLAGVIPQECSVFKSALSPLRLTFRTIGKYTLPADCQSSW